MKKILLLLSLGLLASCGPDIEQARQVKKGMSTNELKYLLGEPIDIEVDNGSEVWYFEYWVDRCDHQNGLHVTIVNKKVEDFYSY